MVCPLQVLRCLRILKDLLLQRGILILEQSPVGVGACAVPWRIKMAREVGKGSLQRSGAKDTGLRALWAEITPFRRDGEQLRFVRFCMVLVSFAPLFLLMAIRGNSVVGDWWMWGGCISLFALPALFLGWRILLVWRNAVVDEIGIGEVADSQSHVLGYLFATMLPFYRSSIEQWRDLAALAVALVFIVLVFWCLRWHYVNWMLLLTGYRVYNVTMPEASAHSGRRTPVVLITKGVRPLAGSHVRAKRVSDTVYWETGHEFRFHRN